MAREDFFEPFTSRTAGFEDFLTRSNQPRSFGDKSALEKFQDLLQENRRPETIVQNEQAANRPFFAGIEAFVPEVIRKEQRQRQLQEIMQSPDLSQQEKQSALFGISPEAAKIFADIQPKATELPSDIRELMILQQRPDLLGLDIARRTATSPKTTVNVGNEQQTELEKTLGKKQGEFIVDKMRDIDSKAINAQDINNTLSQMEAAIDAGIDTGGAEPFFLRAKEFAKSFGIDINEDLSSQEQFRQLGNQLALRMRNPESGFGLTGNTSDRDVKFLLDSVPSLSNTPEGNRLIISMWRKNNEHKVRKQQFINEILSNNNGEIPTDILKTIGEWEKENPVFTKEEVLNIRKSIKTTKKTETKRLKFNPDIGDFE